MDERFMKLALEEARHALSLNEVPVGAVIVCSGKVISRAHNLCRAADDATQHAELICIRDASRSMGGRLSGCTLYTTLEPCMMCTGAALNAKVSRVVYGAFDEQAGCCGSVIDAPDGWFNHSMEVVGGVMEEACMALLKTFFEGIREDI